MPDAAPSGPEASDGVGCQGERSLVLAAQPIGGWNPPHNYRGVARSPNGPSGELVPPCGLWVKPAHEEPVS